MRTVLLDQNIKGVIQVEVARDPGEETAVLTVRNAAKIDREIRTRHHRTKMRATNIPDSAHALFELIIKNLQEKGFSCGKPHLHNLPNLPSDQTDFSASVTIEVGKQSNEALQDVFKTAMITAEQRMGAIRYQRKLGGNWTDRKGGTNAGTQGL